MSADNSKFNLAPLLSKGKGIAVWCPERDLALEFVEAVRKYSPNHFRHWSGRASNDQNWDHSYSATCYLPNLNGYHGVTHFQYSNKTFFEEEGYEIIPVTDLLECADLGEITDFTPILLDLLE